MAKGTGFSLHVNPQHGWGFSHEEHAGAVKGPSRIHFRTYRLKSVPFDKPALPLPVESCPFSTLRTACSPASRLKYSQRFMLLTRILLLLVLLIASIAGGLPAMAQTPNQRLILKDGTYQVVTKYERVGDRVRYYSSERGQWEEVPAELVDFAATEKWVQDHTPGAQPAAPALPEAQELDKEEQQERARTPDVAHGLRLPDEDGVWALDTFHDQPELVPLIQNTGNGTGEIGHNVLRATLNPSGVIQQNTQIAGSKSKVRLHVNDLALYVSITGTDDNAAAASSAVTVETHAAPPPKDKNSFSSANSQYVILRVRSNYKKDVRIVSGIRIGTGGNASQTEDVIPTTAQMLPGNRWMKLTPREPLTIGDYALMELLRPGEVNLSVWDFRIDPQAADNKNAIIPLQR